MLGKCVILVGGSSKGTRFRPLSLDVPKPLFPIGGFPIVFHHIEKCAKIPSIKEIILIGSYQMGEEFGRFMSEVQRRFLNIIHIRYLQEYTPLGTAGGLYHFRDQIMAGDPDYFFVINADVCFELSLLDFIDFHASKGSDRKHHTLLTTETTPQQSLTYGCAVVNKETQEVIHYVEKPSTFISTTINCGVYIFSPSIFNVIRGVFERNHADVNDLFLRDSNPRLNESYDLKDPYLREVISLEYDIVKPLAGNKQLYAFHTSCFWSQIKTAAAAIYSNRHILSSYLHANPERLRKNGLDEPKIVGDVFIHPTAHVHPSAKIGPNVSVGKNVNIGAGVRIRESIILDGATIRDHSCIIYSVVGWSAVIGQWTRVEGTPNDPNPNKPFAKIEALNLFNDTGKLNPSICVIGAHVQVASEVVVLNSIVLPNKDLIGSYKNQIIL